MPDNIITPSGIELDAHGLRVEIMKLIEKMNCDSAVISLALADVLATVAVALDKHMGEMSLDARLSVFLRRVEETYNRTRMLADAVPFNGDKLVLSPPPVKEISYGR